MNISLPQNPDAIAEIKEIMSMKQTFMSSKNSTPMLSLKEDMITGWYMLTQGLVPVKKDIWLDAVIQLGIDFVTQKLKQIRSVYRTIPLFQEIKTQLAEESSASSDQLDELALDRLVYSGFGLFSMLFPNDFEMTIVNRKSKDGKPVQITQGTMISGTLNKDVLGNDSGCLMHHIAKDYGNQIASEFVYRLESLVCDIFQHIGFSVGIRDYIPTSLKPIEKAIEDAFFKVISHMENQPDPYIRELKICSELDQPSQKGLAYATETLHKDTNNLVAMVDCGSKGTWVNIAKITSVLGQYFVQSQRIKKVFGGRTLCCFPRYSLRSDTPDQLPLHFTYPDVQRIIQSRGFIQNSFFNGLNPIEYFLISLDGRQGLVATQINTAETGYISRKIAKILEDIQISYAGTVVTPSQNIIQFAYGGDNLDAAKMIRYQKDPTRYSFIDIRHATDRVNKQFEIKSQK